MGDRTLSKVCEDLTNLLRELTKTVDELSMILGSRPERTEWLTPEPEPAPVSASASEAVPEYTGALIRRLRESYGLSRPQLASALNVSSSTIREWERNQADNVIPKKYHSKMAHTFKCAEQIKAGPSMSLLDFMVKSK